MTVALAESTKKDRNRESPRFSVANIPVASQTAMGTLFSFENRSKRIAVASDFPSQGKTSQGWERRLKKTFGAQKSLRFFRLRQKIAIAMAEKSRHLVDCSLWGLQSLQSSCNTSPALLGAASMQKPPFPPNSPKLFQHWPWDAGNEPQPPKD